MAFTVFLGSWIPSLSHHRGAFASADSAIVHSGQITLVQHAADQALAGTPIHPYWEPAGIVVAGDGGIHPRKWMGIRSGQSRRRRNFASAQRSGLPRAAYSASAQIRGASPSPKNSTLMTLGLQQTGQSSTYCCSVPPDGSRGTTIRSPQDGQTYAPSSEGRRRFFFRFCICMLAAPRLHR